MNSTEYLERIRNSKSTLNITQIAKDYGMSGQAMNELLNKLGVQYLMNGQWLLYSKYQSEGYVHAQPLLIERSTGEDEVRLHTQWTQRGRLFLYGLLKENGCLPVIERE